MKLDGPRAPLLATLTVLVVLYASAAFVYDGFLSLRVILNLLTDNAFLGVVAVGMTFVILSGGIDLSVGAVLALATVLMARLVELHAVPPLVAIPCVLAAGTAFGAGLGHLAARYRLAPFLVTLAGMFLARGLAFVVHEESLGIAHPFYGAVARFSIPVTARAGLTATALVFLATTWAALWLGHFTRFGRNVYAVGGDEEAALFMGLPVARTKTRVYALSGFCAALGGVVATFYTGSGNPAMGLGLELDAIAAVVIGGTLLTGGVGHVGGTFLGVLILGTLQSALIFDGRLSSWWLRIATGVLLLAFILLQRLLAGRGAKPPRSHGT